MQKAITEERLNKIPHSGRFMTGLLDCERWFDINTNLRAAHFLAQCYVESDKFKKQHFGEKMFYSSAERIVETWSKISLKHARALTSVGPRDAKQNRALAEAALAPHQKPVKGGGPGEIHEGPSYWRDMAFVLEHYPAQRDRQHELADAAYGGWEKRGAGLIQVTTDANRSAVLNEMCRIYKKETSTDADGATDFIEAQQGIAPNGAASRRLTELAKHCNKPEDFVDQFAALMKSSPYYAAVSAGAYWYITPTRKDNLNTYADNDDVDAISCLVNRGSKKLKPKNGLEERRAALNMMKPIFGLSPSA